MKDFLNQNWLGSLIGLAGIILAVFLAFFVRPRSRIASQVNSLELLGNNQALPKEIEFLFRGQRVSKVTLSRVAIWNKGNVTLKRDQIVAADPLRIVTSGGSEVLDARIHSRTRDVNDFSCLVRPSRNEVECTFDYLDPSDGVVIELIHTGDDKVQVVGTLRGVPRPVLVIGVQKPQEQRQAQASRFGSAFFGVLLLLGGGTFLGFSLLLPYAEGTPIAVFLGAVLAILGTVALVFIGRIPPGHLSTQITSGVPPKKRSIFRR